MEATITQSGTRVAPVAPPDDRRPNPVYALAQAFAGLLVPLLLLRLVKPLISPRRPSRGRFLRPLVVFGLAGIWFLVLFQSAAMFAFMGFPPFNDPPKFQPLTAVAVGGAFFRGLMGVVQT